MASSGSLSSLLLSKPHSFLPRNPNPNLNSRVFLPFRTQTVSFSANSEQKDKLSDSPVSEKKSFAVATGELFLGLASRIIKSRSSKDSVSVPVTMFRDIEDSEGQAYLSGPRDRIASVLEDTIDPEVIWEQRLRDVEAEKDRKKITNPGFSFSAAGLLFPYHLGVAQFLIEKGYIKVDFLLLFFTSTSRSI